MIELKPCPFCGSKNIRISLNCFVETPRLSNSRYGCICVGCNVLTDPDATDENGAAMHWNTRYPFEADYNAGFDFATRLDALAANIPPSGKAIDALAESWASIDGVIDDYISDKSAEDYGTGVYIGYQHEAGEMIKRMERLGYTVVPIEITKEMAWELENSLATPLPPCETHRANWASAYRAMLVAVKE